MTEPRRRRPPPRRTLSPPLPTPPMPTKKQYALITHNLGIKSSWQQPHGWFAHDLHYHGSLDDMIDAVAGPAKADDCEKYKITPSEWHAVVSGVLAHAAFSYECTIPYNDAEIEVLIDIADESWRPRLRDLMRGGMTFMEASRIVGAEEKAAAA